MNFMNQQRFEQIIKISKQNLQKQDFFIDSLTTAQFQIMQADQLLQKIISQLGESNFQNRLKVILKKTKAQKAQNLIKTLERQRQVAQFAFQKKKKYLKVQYYDFQVNLEKKKMFLQYIRVILSLFLFLLSSIAIFSSIFSQMEFSSTRIGTIIKGNNHKIHQYILINSSNVIDINKGQSKENQIWIKFKDRIMGFVCSYIIYQVAGLVILCLILIINFFISNKFWMVKIIVVGVLTLLANLIISYLVPLFILTISKEIPHQPKQNSLNVSLSLEFEKLIKSYNILMIKSVFFHIFLIFQ